MAGGKEACLDCYFHAFSGIVQASMQLLPSSCGVRGRGRRTIPLHSGVACDASGALLVTANVLMTSVHITKAFAGG